MELRFYLDGNIYDEPKDADDLVITIERDDVIKGLLKKFTNTVTFYGDAYNYLFGIKQASGFCNQVVCLVQYRPDPFTSWATLIDGIIQVTDIKFTHYPFYLAAVTIEDNGFTTYINNNKNIKAVPYVGKSKNGEVITPVSQTLIGCFDTVTGTYDYRDVVVYQVDKCLAFIVAFMTDGLVTYSSPLFGNGGDLEFLYLCRGSDLNFNADPIFDPTWNFSFLDIFDELDKRFNISFKIDYSVSPPNMIIDKTENLFSSTVITTFSDPDRVEESYDATKLYSSVKLGTNTVTEYDGANFNFPPDEFIGWKEETYHVIGQCNIDSELDLSCNWITDSNTIEDVLKNLNTAYDDDIFLIMCDGGGTQAKIYTLGLPSPPAFYNLNMSNQAVAINHFGAIPAAIANYLALDANTFRAGLTVDFPVGAGIVIWDDDTPPKGNDPGSNYDTTNGKFTAPLDGGYSFSVNFKYSLDPSVTATVGEGVLLTSVYFVRRDSGGTLIEQSQGSNLGILNNPVIVTGYQAHMGFYMNAGDTVTIEVGNETAGAVTILVDGYDDYSYFKADLAPDEGGRYMEYDTGEYRIINYLFEYPFTGAQMTAILSGEDGRINFSLNHVDFGGWIKSIKMKVKKSMASVTLLTKQNFEI